MKVAWNFLFLKTVQFTFWRNIKKHKIKCITKQVSNFWLFCLYRISWQWVNSNKHLSVTQSIEPLIFSTSWIIALHNCQMQSATSEQYILQRSVYLYLGTNCIYIRYNSIISRVKLSCLEMESSNNSETLLVILHSLRISTQIPTGLCTPVWNRKSLGFQVEQHSRANKITAKTYQSLPRLIIDEVSSHPSHLISQATLFYDRNSIDWAVDFQLSNGPNSHLRCSNY